MSEVMDVAAMLIASALGTFCIILCFERALSRKDQIVAGLVDGVRVSSKHRWNMLFIDFMAYANTCTFLCVIFAYGYFRIARNESDSMIGDVGFVFGIGAAGGATAIFLTVLVWYMASLLRQAAKDSP